MLRGLRLWIWVVLTAGGMVVGHGAQDKMPCPGRDFVARELLGAMESKLSAIAVEGSTVIEQMSSGGAMHLGRTVEFQTKMGVAADPRLSVDLGRTKWFDPTGKEQLLEEFRLRRDGTRCVKLIQKVVENSGDREVRHAVVDEALPSELGSGGFAVGTWADWTKLSVLGGDDLRRLLDREIIANRKLMGMAFPPDVKPVGAGIGTWDLREEDGGVVVCLQNRSSEAVWRFVKVREIWVVEMLRSRVGLINKKEAETTQRQEFRFEDWVDVGDRAIPRKMTREVYHGRQLISRAVSKFSQVSEAKIADADVSAVVPDGWTILDAGTRTLMRTERGAGEAMKGLDRIQE